jgi:spermidine synthase
MRAIATIASAISGEIKVYRDGPSGLMTYTQGGYEQSAADRNGVSTATYIHALYGLVLQTRARTALVIGCGGGSLARMLQNAGTAVTVIDIDPASFELARWYFGLPDACERHVADGQEFLKRDDRRFDAIVLDAYDAAQMPAHLAEPEFFELVKQHLAPGGAFFVNAYIRNDDDPFARDTAARLARVWRHVRMLDMKGRINRNAILMAGNVEALAQPTLITPPEVEATEIEQDLRLLAFAATPKKRPRKKR